MLKTFVPLIIFFLLLIDGLSARQSRDSTGIKGVVADSVSTALLENAVVSLINAKDSTLLTFTRTRPDGSFLIDHMEGGNLILVVSYPNYADFVERIQFSGGKIDLGNIKLLPLPKLLEEVVIVGRNAITIKGDTIEYDPAAYVIQPDSKVEDLLKQLPGIQVDKYGRIIAQGQPVKKVLLDGEEFFGDDPTLITRNIRGYMIEKIQVYDKKSEQAEFTGLEDGKRLRTVNVTLKASASKGKFGKVEAGIGSKYFYEAQAMLNKFANWQKMAVFGTVGNTGRLGLNRQDNDQYAASSGVGMGYNSSGMVSQDQLEDARYNGQGIPEVYSGGAHFDRNKRDNKHKVNVNYKTGSLQIEGNSVNDDLRTLPDGIINTTSDQHFKDKTFRQTLDAKYETALSRTSMLRAYVRGGLKHSSSSNNFTSSGVDGDSNLLNLTHRNVAMEGDERFFQADLLWNKKLRKEGRMISVELEQMNGRMNRDRMLHADIGYYKGGNTADSTVLIDQLKTDKNNNSNFNTNIVYTEPLATGVQLSFNYHFNLNNGNADQLSYNRLPDGKYTALDSSFSNVYELGQYTNLLGVGLTYSRRKGILSVGMSGAQVNFRQTDKFTGNVYRRSFANYNPKAALQLRISGEKMLRFDYQGYNVQPSMSQIQPLRSNIDPLNVLVGNPDLKPSFRHAISGMYIANGVISGRVFMASLDASISVNDITSRINTNSQGESVYQYENLQGRTPHATTGYLYYGGDLKKAGMSLGGIINYSNSCAYNRVNEGINKLTSNVISLYLNARKSVQNKYSVSLELGPSYTENKSSLQHRFSNKGWGANAVGSTTIYLPGKLEFTSDMNYTYYPATTIFSNSFSRFIWNAGLNRKFLKKNVLKLGLRANDILNENAGFNRTTSQNSITQQSYTTIRRYFMLSISWNFGTM